MSKPVPAVVTRCIATQDGTWLAVVRLKSPKQDVSVRSPERLRDGAHVMVAGYGVNWRLA